jgi:GDPmannose 4,6-dehydratase
MGYNGDAQVVGFRNLDVIGIKDQVHLFSMALNDFRSVITVLTRANPDEIYYLAGQSSVGLSLSNLQKH